MIKFDANDIKDAMLWDGEADVLIDSLVSAGFIDVYDDGGMYVHDWSDYAGKLLEKRAKDRERKRGITEVANFPSEFHRNSIGIRWKSRGKKRTVPNRT